MGDKYNTFNHINQVIDGDILTNQYVNVMHLVVLEDDFDQLFIDLGQLQGCGHLHTAALGETNLHIWLLLVQSQAHLLQLDGQFPSLILSLVSFQHHQHQITSLGHCDDLPTTTTTLRSSLNDSG